MFQKLNENLFEFVQLQYVLPGSGACTVTGRLKEVTRDTTTVEVFDNDHRSLGEWTIYTSSIMGLGKTVETQRLMLEVFYEKELTRVEP